MKLQILIVLALAGCTETVTQAPPQNDTVTISLIRYEGMRGGVNARVNVFNDTDRYLDFLACDLTAYSGHFGIVATAYGYGVTSNLVAGGDIDADIVLSPTPAAPITHTNYSCTARTSDETKRIIGGF